MLTPLPPRAQLLLLINAPLKFVLSLISGRLVSVWVQNGDEQQVAVSAVSS